MSLFRLVAKIGVDTSEFESGLKRAELSLGMLGTSLAGVFSLSTAASIIKATGDIADLADQLELSTKQIQELQMAAAKSGVEFDKFAAAIGRIRKAQADALGGDSKASDLLNRLGVNPREDAGDALKRIGFTQDKAALFELLGSKSARLHSALKEIKSLSPVELIGDEQIRQIDQAQDRMHVLWKFIEVNFVKGLIGFGKGGTLGPLYEQFIKPMIEEMNRKPPGHGESLRLGGASFGARHLLDRGQDVPIEELPATAEGPRFPMLERLIGRRKFSPISMGDRANVGGFFGPNADVNQKLQRMATNVEQIAKGLDAIAKVVVPAGRDNQ